MQETTPFSSSVNSSGKMKEAIKDARKVRNVVALFRYMYKCMYFTCIQELDSARVQLHSMLGLFDSEPNLREAFHQSLEGAREKVAMLQEEREDTEKLISDWHASFRDNSEKGPTEDDW